jgi:hypothetical protein
MLTRRRVRLRLTAAERLLRAAEDARAAANRLRPVARVMRFYARRDEAKRRRICANGSIRRSQTASLRPLPSFPLVWSFLKLVKPHIIQSVFWS